MRRPRRHSAARRTAFALAVALAWAFAARPAPGWLAEGHRRVARAAAAELPGGVPDFFRAAGEDLARHATAPDLYKLAAAGAALVAAENPEHYLHVEALGGGAGQAARAEAARGAASGAEGPPPPASGRLQLAIVEHTERLAVAFALHRRRPDDPAAAAQVLVWAGALAHYAADLEQPLHLTVHHDGWALADGSSPATGFHRRVDALLERVRFDPAGALAGFEPRPFADLEAAVRAELAASHAQLDRVYALEPLLDADDGHARPEIALFACERWAAAVRFVTSLWLTAWVRSATLELPDWAVR